MNREGENGTGNSKKSRKKRTKYGAQKEAERNRFKNTEEKGHYSEYREQKGEQIKT